MGCHQLLKIISQKNDWERVLNLFKNLDVYYSYEYGKLFERVDKGELLGAYFERGNDRLFYPFILRSINIFEGLYYDIVTPYGYGGPYVEGDKNIVGEFYKEFEQYCNEKRIITETIRFHPLLENHDYCKSVINLQYIRQTTAVNLEDSLINIRDEYTSMNKRNIKKAIKNNIRCFVAEKTLENINIFKELYEETMNRNKALDYYYFDQEFFINQLENTKISKSYLLFAEYDLEIIAGVIVLIGKNFAHYHLGASRTEYLKLRPNNLLFDFMIEFSKQKECSLLHLGGGYQENDGLFQFKTSFTNGNNYDYYIGKRIYNPKVYEELNRLIEEKYEVNPNYFPKYRGIIKKK